ncbi:MAG: allophanate hydrolase [Nitrospiraceae bacterium]|nr:MAG: allophanate hydrolase [Nitrospiraceae bacterium]
MTPSTPAVNDRAVSFARAVERARVPGVVEVVPAYRSAAVYIDPVETDFALLRDALRALAGNLPMDPGDRRRIVTIPVLYGGEAGPDLPALAERAGLSVEQAIALHASVEYRVYMLGFSPGFPYLGMVPDAIAAPRLPEPRINVPAGSVGIAGRQTGIYPQDSPGGWRVIGRTPLVLYDPARTEPFLLEPGDRVRFVPIDRREFDRVKEELKR